MKEFTETIKFAGEQIAKEVRENDALRKFLYLMPTVLWIKDYSNPVRGGIYVFVSREWEYSVGRKRDQVIGLTDFDFMPKSEAERNAMNDRHTLDFKTQVVVNDGIGTRYNGYKPMRTALVPFGVCGEQEPTHVGGFVMNNEIRTL